MASKWTNKGLRRQVRVHGREGLAAGLEPRVKAWVEAKALQHKVTRPFVMSVAIAAFAKIDIDDSFITGRKG